jgi:hypothetical protein
MLKHPYISIQCEDGSVSYGGNQSWLPTPAERSFGCGFIAAADILRYLMEREELNSDKPPLTKKQYLEDMLLLSKDFPVRGKLGITGFGLARRMNRLFRRNGLPYRSKWSIGKKRLLRRLPEMLDADIPVLLSAGPGFFHKEERLALYTPEGGVYKKSNSMRDHYVTVTGRITGKAAAGNPAASAGKRAAGNAVGSVGEKAAGDTAGNVTEDEILYRISSWGSEYYIREQEYLDYVKKYDNFLFSSILYIRRNG